jgi:hypothetical protein
MPQNTIGVACNQTNRHLRAVGAPIAYFCAAKDEGELTCLEAGND